EVKISNRLAALENLDDNVDINTAWETFRENIMISAREKFAHLLNECGIIEAYYCYQLHTKCYPVSISQVYNETVHHLFLGLKKDYGLRDIDTKIATAEQSTKMVSDIEVRMKEKCVIEFLTAKQIVPIDIHRHLLKVYRDNTVDVSTVIRWAVYFNSGKIEVHDKPRYGRPCSAATPHNEQRFI
ncbi:hypothetical protein B7P43_G03494, partial [Cryptotermes secundus]